MDTVLFLLKELAVMGLCGALGLLVAFLAWDTSRP